MKGIFLSFLLSQFNESLDEHATDLTFLTQTDRQTGGGKEREGEKPEKSDKRNRWKQKSDWRK